MRNDITSTRGTVPSGVLPPAVEDIEIEADIDEVNEADMANFALDKQQFTAQYAAAGTLY